MCAPKAPKPDPNIGAAAASSAQVANDTLAWNKQMYEDQKPILKAQNELAQQFAQSALASNKQNDDLSAAYAKRMQDTFYPVQDSMVAQASTAGGAQDQEQYANQARGDNAIAQQNQNQQNLRTSQSYGINPNSGQYQGMLQQQGISNAAVEANAMNQARINARNLGWAKQSDAVAMGQGLPGNQATSSQMALSAANSGNASAMAPIQGSVSAQGAQNQGRGTALQGYNQQGQLGLGSYQGQLQGYQTQMDMYGAMVGAAGSLGAAGIGAM